MAKVIGPYDQDLGEVTDQGHLDFYRGTPGYTVIETPTTVQSPESLPKPRRAAPKKAAKKAAGKRASKAAAKPASMPAAKTAAAGAGTSSTTPSTPASNRSTTREENPKS